MKKILDLNNLVIRFHGKENTTYAVNSISFDIRQGETLGIVGESGSGKTVTAKSVLRITDNAKIKDGSILFNGLDLLKTSEKEMRKIRGNNISMIFQDPQTSLNPVFTIGNQMIDIIVRHKDISRKKAREIASDWLALVGITNPSKRLNLYPHELSGGMRQRVIIAMALCLEPEIVIADEPTTALDVTIQSQILNLINDLKSKINSSILLITHDLGVIANTCDRVIVMYGGKIMESSNVNDLFDNPKHPYTLGLLNALPKSKNSLEKLIPIPGNPPDNTKKILGCPFYERCSEKMDICEKRFPKTLYLNEDHFLNCWLYVEEDSNE